MNCEFGMWWGSICSEDSTINRLFLCKQEGFKLHKNDDYWDDGGDDDDYDDADDDDDNDADDDDDIYNEAIFWLKYWWQLEWSINAMVIWWAPVWNSQASCGQGPAQSV